MQKSTQFFLVAYLFCIWYFSKTKSEPAKKNTGQCFSTEMRAACKYSANLEQETETAKIVTYPLFTLASSFSIHATVPILNILLILLYLAILMSRAIIMSRSDLVILSLVFQSLVSSFIVRSYFIANQLDFLWLDYQLDFMTGLLVWRSKCHGNTFVQFSLVLSRLCQLNYCHDLPCSSLSG